MTTRFHVLGGALLFLSMAGCGGGGAQQTPTVTTLATLETVLRDTAGAARSAAVLVVRSDGELRLTLTGESAWMGSVTDVLLRQGDVGVVGEPVASFMPPGSAFDAASLALVVSAQGGAPAASALAAAPGSHHLAILTSGSPTGLARGQLAAFSQIECHARLADGRQPSLASGVLTGRTMADGSTTAVLAVVGMSVSSAARCELAETGVQLAPLTVDLASAALDGARGTSVQQVTLPLSRLLRIRLRPTAFQVAVFPSVGATPLLTGPVDLDPLGALALVRGSSIDQRGAGLTLQFQTLDSVRASVALSGSPGPSLVQLASFQVLEAPPAPPGNPVIDILAAPDFAMESDQRAGAGTTTIEQVHLTRLIANPGAYAVRVVARASTTSDLTGPLASASVPFNAPLQGGPASHEGLPGAAMAQIWVTSPDTLSFRIDSANPQVAPTTLVGAVVHPTASPPSAGTGFDLLATPVGEQVIQGNRRSGELPLDPQEVARMLAAPWSRDVSLTTPLAANGVATGRLQDGGITLSTDYIPPFEGDWPWYSYQGFLTVSVGKAFAASAPFSATGALSGKAVSMQGSYVGSKATATVSIGGDSATYTGTLEDDEFVLKTTNGTVNLPTTLRALRDKIHVAFDYLWIASSGTYTLAFTQYPQAGPLDRWEPVKGFLTCNGVKVPFSGDAGTDIKGEGVALYLTFQGIDLTPCTAELKALAAKNVYGTYLNGGFENGYGGIMLNMGGHLLHFMRMR